MYPLLESIKIVDGRAQNLLWHQRRLNFSVKKHFGLHKLYTLEDVLNIPESCKTGVVKARFLYGTSGYCCQCEPYNMQEINSLKLVGDDKINYVLKYSDRSSLEKLYENKGECDDILIVKSGRITDSTYCNIVFFDGLKWITPYGPLLKGTCRDRLLTEGKISEEIITVNRLSDFKTFKLINALRDISDVPAIPIERISS